MERAGTMFGSGRQTDGEGHGHDSGGSVSPHETQDQSAGTAVRMRPAVKAEQESAGTRIENDEEIGTGATR